MASDKSYKLISIFLLAFVLLNFPILGIFTGDMIWFGIPALYLYLFIIWISTIFLSWWTISYTGKRNR